MTLDGIRAAQQILPSNVTVVKTSTGGQPETRKIKVIGENNRKNWRNKSQTHGVHHRRFQLEKSIRHSIKGKEDRDEKATHDKQRPLEADNPIRFGTKGEGVKGVNSKKKKTRATAQKRSSNPVTVPRGCRHEFHHLKSTGGNPEPDSVMKKQRAARLRDKVEAGRRKTRFAK